MLAASPPPLLQGLETALSISAQAKVLPPPCLDSLAMMSTRALLRGSAVSRYLEPANSLKSTVLRSLFLVVQLNIRSPDVLVTSGLSRSPRRRTLAPRIVNVSCAKFKSCRLFVAMSMSSIYRTTGNLRDTSTSRPSFVKTATSRTFSRRPVSKDDWMTSGSGRYYSRCLRYVYYVFLWPLHVAGSNSSTGRQVYPRSRLYPPRPQARQHTH